MIVLALDPGSSCGYAFASLSDQNTVDVFEYGAFDIPDALSRGPQCLYLMAEVRKLLAKHPVELVGIEDYFVSGRFNSGVDLNYFFRAAIVIACEQDGMKYEMMNPSNWKVFVAGRSTPTKEQKLRYGKQVAKKAMIVEALRDRYGIKVPNHSISEKTGKPIQFRYDTTDAIGQVMYACNLVVPITRFTCSVAVPADVDLAAPKKRKKDPV